jgi:Tfp pilus assembly protein PilO
MIPALRLRRNDARSAARVTLATLVILNAVAAWFVYYPWGGSAEEMEANLARLRKQAAERQAVLTRTRQLAAKIDKGRTQGDEFLGKYFLSRPTTYSSVVAELNEMAKKAGVKVKEQAFNEEEVEGSDELSMLSISAGYEGSYADLLHFLRELDRADRMVIIESLAASPQQGTGVLNIAVRLNTFVRESPEPAVAALRPAAGGGE